MATILDKMNEAKRREKEVLAKKEESAEFKHDVVFFVKCLTPALITFIIFMFNNMKINDTTSFFAHVLISAIASIMYFFGSAFLMDGEWKKLFNAYTPAVTVLISSMFFIIIWAVGNFSTALLFSSAPYFVLGFLKNVTDKEIM